mgnify:FL=1|jgi:hypothetical protein|tara:strand:- start:149 stop:382 length:234 start_codon:yes stop_codon:yes gene_type:complete
MTQLLAQQVSPSASTLIDSFDRGRSRFELRNGLGFIKGEVIVIRSKRNGQYRMLKPRPGTARDMFVRLLSDFLYTPW